MEKQPIVSSDVGNSNIKKGKHGQKASKNSTAKDLKGPSREPSRALMPKSKVAPAPMNSIAEAKTTSSAAVDSTKKESNNQVEDSDLHLLITESKPKNQKWRDLIRKHKKTIIANMPKDNTLSGGDSTNREAVGFESKDFDKPENSTSTDKKNLIESNRAVVGDTYIRSAIPYLPRPAAVICLIMNIFLPGSGTMVSGSLVFCCGYSRMFIKSGPRATTLCVNLAVGFMQFLTIPFLLVGWIWSLVWGIYFVLLAVKTNITEQYIKPTSAHHSRQQNSAKLKTHQHNRWFGKFFMEKPSLGNAQGHDSNQ